MNTRELFSQAVDWIQEHSVLELEARSAFIYRPSQQPIQDIAAETPCDVYDFNARARSMCDTARAIREGGLSSREAVSSCLERIAVLNAKRILLHRISTSGFTSPFTKRGNEGVFFREQFDSLANIRLKSPWCYRDRSGINRLIFIASDLTSDVFPIFPCAATRQKL